MFEDFGTRQGFSDGMDDANYRRREHPRPSLSLAVISTGYRDAYLAAYHRGYRLRDPAIYDRAADPNDRTLAQSDWAYRDLPWDKRQKAEERDFKIGWKEAMDGKPEKVGQPSAYGRGYRLGKRDRDYAWAKSARLDNLLR